MNVENLTRAERRQRLNVRNFLLVATLPELRRERELSMERGDTFRAECVDELIAEFEQEGES